MARLAIATASLLALHAPAALAMSEADLRVQLGAPDDAQFKVWTGVPDRAIIAWTTLHPDPRRKPGEVRDLETLDQTILVVKTSTGQVMQRSFVAQAYASDSIAFEGIRIDTANYALAPGHRAFALRVTSRKPGCLSYLRHAARMICSVNGAGSSGGPPSATAG